MIRILITPEIDGHFVKLQSNDPSDFQLALGMLKSFIPAHRRKYVPHLRQWFILELAESATGRWLDYCRLHLKAEVDVDRQHTYSERESSPDDPYATLYLLPSAPPELIKAAYKCLATLHHPDKGGDTRMMQRINEAYRQLAA